MDAIEHLLTRGTDKIFPTREALEKVLRGGKKLRLYQGFDPTGTQFHIGHAVGLRKLRQWQDLGHHVIFLIGDGTGQAGDPSGKTRAREKFLSREELRANAKDYVMQAAKVVRFDGPNPVEILYNGDWLNKLGLVEILDIAGRISFQQMIERDLYQERLKSKETMSLREFFYPLLQGYDSVAMKVDLELGGSDQTFNMLMGRQLVKSMQGREKFVMTVPLLTDSKGVKIGKTEGNVIGLTDAPNEFYAKIMSLGDDAIIPCFTLLTDTPIETINDMKKRIGGGGNPMVYKKMLALELTRQFNDANLAGKAQENFENLFQTKTQSISAKARIVLPKIQIDKDTYNPIDLLLLSGHAVSRSEARRLIEQNAVEINNQLVDNKQREINVKKGDIIRIGKKYFVELI